MIDLLTK